MVTYFSVTEKQKPHRVFLLELVKFIPLKGECVCPVRIFMGTAVSHF